MSKTNGKKNGRKNGKPQNTKLTGKPDPATRTPEGKFLPGISGNPGGRPKVARLMLDLAIKLLQEQDENGADKAEVLLRAVLQRAIEGDDMAAKLWLDRVWPATLQADINVQGLVAEHAIDVFGCMMQDYATAGRLPELAARS